MIYEKAKTLPEAIALYAMHEGLYPILAGGTDLIVQLKSGTIAPEGIIDISALDELRTISEGNDTIEIGALTTHAMTASSKIVSQSVPPLAKACRTIGSVQIQNRGTIGGNIMNASPAGDTLPVLLAFDAEFLAQGIKGERWIKAHDFFTAYKKTTLGRDEILTRIRLPKMGASESSTFFKVGTRGALAISKAVMCVRAQVSHGGIERIAIAAGSVAPTTMRAFGTEALLKGQVISPSLIDKACRSIQDEIHPIDDIRSTANYRRFVCGALLARFLSECVTPFSVEIQRKQYSG